MKTNPKVEAAEAGYEAAKRRRTETQKAVSAAQEALNAASEAHTAACAEEREAGRLLDDAHGFPTCEMDRGSSWTRMVITRRTQSSLWVRDYGRPNSAETRFVLSAGGWLRYGDTGKSIRVYLRGVP